MTYISSKYPIIFEIDPNSDGHWALKIWISGKGLTYKLLNKCQMAGQGDVRKLWLRKSQIADEMELISIILFYFFTWWGKYH